MPCLSIEVHTDCSSSTPEVGRFGIGRSDKMTSEFSKLAFTPLLPTTALSPGRRQEAGLVGDFQLRSKLPVGSI